MSSNNSLKINDTFNLDLLFELSPDFICIAGYDGYFKRINGTVSKTLGYTKEELFAKPIHEFVHPDDRFHTAQKRESLINNSPLLNFENRYITKEGKTIWLSWTSMPLENEKVVFAIAKNITHKRRLEEERNLLLANLTKTNHNLKQLTYTTSHDLRSPVNNLLAIFSLINASEIKDEKVLDLLELLKMATVNLKDTLDGYVDALVDKEVLKIDIQELDFRECLHSVLLSLGSLIKDSKTELHVDFSAFTNINFNRNYLISIFLNLITNSIKYVKPGNHPVISIFSQMSGSVKQLVFIDEGLGFDMENIKDKVFGFHQKFHEHEDSKGIGLYLINNHVLSLGGRIELESKLNEGARFTISFT